MRTSRVAARIYARRTAEHKIPHHAKIDELISHIARDMLEGDRRERNIPIRGVPPFRQVGTYEMKDGRKFRITPTINFSGKDAVLIELLHDPEPDRWGEWLRLTRGKRAV